MDDAFERRPFLTSLKSYGPDWDAAVAYGIDVSLLEKTLLMSVEERFVESVQLTRFAAELAEARERLHGCCSRRP